MDLSHYLVNQLLIIVIISFNDLSMTDQIDVLIAGAGTGGTVSGIGRKLKERIPNVKVRFILKIYLS